MPDENRVFDVSKPGRGSPSPTSKPIIVGHQPRINDPMVNKEEGGGLNFGTEAPATKITVQDAIHAHGIEPPASDEPKHDSWIAPEPEEPKPAEAPAPDPAPAPTTLPEPFPAAHEPSNPPARDDAPNPAVAEPVPDFSGHVEGLHLSPPKKKGNTKYAILGVVILLIAAYLAIDSGAIGSGINLPFHIFKQKTPAPATTSNSVPVQNPVPAGFTKYSLSGTNIIFDAPTSWGQPSSTLDPGYTARGANNQSDGTYAYLVDFAANKDVEVAVTSSKYLPAARASLYYDFLQWCIGTNDGKYYLQSLHFTTSAAKIDSPATIACDQGPVDNAQKLDSSTILMPQVKASDGKTVIGDIYVKNLSDPALPVFRVKDATGKNGTDITQLLSTIKTD
jgi:hypothetical protein